MTKELNEKAAFVMDVITYVCGNQEDNGEEAMEICRLLIASLFAEIYHDKRLVSDFKEVELDRISIKMDKFLIKKSQNQ